MTSFLCWNEAGEKLEITRVQNENKDPTSQQDIQCPLKTTFLFRFLSTYFLTSCSFFFFKNKTKPKKKRYFYANYRTLCKGLNCFVQSRFDILLQPFSLTRERTKKSQQLAFNKDSKNERVGRSAGALQKDSPSLGD